MSAQHQMDCVMIMLLVTTQLVLVPAHVIQDLVAMERFVLVCKLTNIY